VDKVFALAPGAWSDPIDTPRGWVVVRREPYLRAHVRHVLVGHRQSWLPKPPERERPEAGARAREELKAARAGHPASWDAVVRKYTDDAESRTRGGSVGDVTNADVEAHRFPPEVEEAVWALAPGALGTDVVESRFGFHVLWRVD
jgi:parvulin-like peptidyl-prolyl isomerase